MLRGGSCPGARCLGSLGDGSAASLEKARGRGAAPFTLPLAACRCVLGGGRDSRAAKSSDCILETIVGTLGVSLGAGERPLRSRWGTGAQSGRETFGRAGEVREGAARGGGRRKRDDAAHTRQRPEQVKREEECAPTGQRSGIITEIYDRREGARASSEPPAGAASLPFPSVNTLSYVLQYMMLELHD